MRTNYIHPDVRYSSGKKIHLDIFVPSIKLAIEYQGRQYYAFHYLYGRNEKQRQRDEQKRKVIILILLRYSILIYSLDIFLTLCCCCCLFFYSSYPVAEGCWNYVGGDTLLVGSNQRELVCYPLREISTSSYLAREYHSEY